jgi:hypothetical protein
MEKKRKEGHDPRWGAAGFRPGSFPKSGAGRKERGTKKATATAKAKAKAIKKSLRLVVPLLSGRAAARFSA